MINVEIDEITDADIDAIAENMRLDDKLETWASCRMLPLDVVRLSVAGSSLSKVGRVDGKPVVVFGVGSPGLLSAKGVPWMLAIEGFEKYAIAFLRRCRKGVREMAQDYEVLENWVDDRNTTSIKWLKWMGFKMDDPVPYGISQKPFRRFYMKGLLDV